MENQMFCYQCQETAGCTGCTRVGVCGKTPDVAAMQDLLVYVTKGIAAVAVALGREGQEVSPEVNRTITQNLFATITNANFDKERIEGRIATTLEEKKALFDRLSGRTTCRRRRCGTVPGTGQPRQRTWGCCPRKMRTSVPSGS